MSKTIAITIEELRAKLSYDPATGVFVWLVDVSKNVKKGMEAGTTKAIRTSSKNGNVIKYKYIRLQNLETPAARVAWAMHYGAWPEGNILFADKDSTNLKINNLEQARFPSVVTEKGGLKSRKMSRNTQRHYGLKRYYDLSLAEYGDMLVAQNGVCAICKKQERAVVNGFHKPLAVDHNHSTGKIRGLLCSGCNQAIGLLCEDTSILANAIKYLDSHLEDEKNVLE